MLLLPCATALPAGRDPDPRAAAVLASACHHAVRDIDYATSPDAPNNWARLQAECTPTRITVWDGASDRGLLGSADNYAYRAWHDSVHLKVGADFSIPGEHTAALAQLQELRAILVELGTDPDLVADVEALFWAESWGQVAHVERFGKFPLDQLAFDMAYFSDGLPTVAL